MQGWLFLTFVVVGSLVGITGMRLFFFDPLPTTALNVTWFVLQITPLLLTLPSAMRGKLKGMFFLCLVSTLYLVQGVLNVFDPNLFYWGVAEVFFALALCGITALYVRKLREYNAANEVDGDTERD
jgi:uncharacterized membrane protein